MAEVRPFRGLRYNPAKVKDLGSVIAPPFDVISRDEQDDLHARSEYNVVRLELARSGGKDAYAGAGEALRRWVRDGVLVAEKQPAYYLARHEFTHLGRKVVRTELTGAVRLEELDKGIIRPHEDTRSKAKEDRLQLMRATRANISPVMLLYDGLQFPEPASAPIEADLGEGERFRIWPITEDAAVRRIHEELASRTLYIADGHHRYETALNYRNEVKAGPDDAASYVMAALISFSDPGLLVLPYHRLLKGLDAGAMARLAERFSSVCVAEQIDVSRIGVADVARRAMDALTGPPLFALYGMEHRRLTVLSLRNARTIDEIAGRGHSRAWAGLAYCIFREAILRPVLGLQEEEAEAKGLLSFARDTAEAVQKVNHKQCQVAVLCKAVPFETFRQISDRGERLPPKSTYFSPKLPTGLVLKSLEGTL